MDLPTYTRKDFLSTTAPKWCPGCGDYSVLKALTSVFAELSLPKERYLIVSGIGCSSRLPYYMSTYGIHGIHGRAPTIALGAKITNPKLSVWVVTGDGDALSIGGNHFIHLIRRDADINVILFNNQTYGLTKGQASPTSPKNSYTRSSPYGTLDNPINPLALALAAGATFAARVLDIDQSMLKTVLKSAVEHIGTAIVEVLTNCVIFNHTAFRSSSYKAERQKNSLFLRKGKMMVFGQEEEFALLLRKGVPCVLKRAEVDEQELLIHQPQADSNLLSLMLSQLEAPSFPIPLGILRQRQDHAHEVEQTKNVTDKKNTSSLIDILTSDGESWKIST